MNKKLFLPLLCISLSLQAGIEFSDQSSTVRVKSGAGLNIGAGGQTVTGTIKHDSGGIINGTVLTFSDGIIDQDGKTAIFTGAYDGDADPGPAFALQGSSTLDAGRNFSVNALSVSGASNTISGTPVFANPIILGSSVDLTCGITDVLNKNIVVDDGTVSLTANLFCANDVAIKGTGSVALDGYRYVLAPHYSSALTGTIAFNNALNIELQGRTPCNADYTFSGTSSINGKGQTLDLTSGGTITIAADSTLTLRDILLYGVSNSNIIFESATSKLEVDQASLQLTENITTTTGIVYVAGDSTFVLSNKDWTFSDDGNLTVDGAILSLNVANNGGDAESGTIKAPLPVYEEGGRLTENITSNTSGNNMSLINGGVITEGAGLGGGSGAGVGPVALTNSNILSPADIIEVAEDTVLDGSGSRTIFSRVATPQLVVNAGVTYTIKNVELSNLVNTSIELKEGAKLRVGEGVIFTLADDIVWENGQIEVVDDNTVFEIRSAGGLRHFELRSNNIGGTKPHEVEYETHLNIGTNSLQLHNVLFRGLRHVSSQTALVNGVSTTGAIVLGGAATVDVDVQTTPETFIIRGFENRMRFLLDDVYLRGNVRYEGVTTSVLRVEFLLPAGSHRTPELHMNSGAVNVSSALGHAYFVFDTPSVKLVNHSSDSFVLGQNGFLSGNKVEVVKNPIKQVSGSVTLSPGLFLSSKLPQGALVPDTALLDSMRSPSLFRAQYDAVTAFEMREWGRIGLLTHTRGVQLPNENLTTVLHYESGLTLPELAGNVHIYEERSTRYTNFGISTSRDVNMTMQDGATVVQSTKASTLKSTDIWNVVGGTAQHPNTLEITNDLTINGKLLLDDDAVLHIRCVLDSTPPVITFGANSTVEFGARSTLMITGKGTVKVADGFVFDLGSTNGNLILSDSTELLLSDAVSAKIQGKGKVLCERGGGITVEGGSDLKFGNTYSDDLTVQVRTGASIRVGNVFTSDSGNSYLSFGKADASLDFSQGGTLTIADKGIFEINAAKGVSDPGTMSRVDFGGSGLLYIASGGSLQIADNLVGAAGTTLALHGSQITGTGIIGVFNGLLQGRIQSNITSATNLTAEQVVRTLTQTNDTLTHSTVFINENGDSRVFSKNGVVITLAANEVILEESADGTLSGYHTLTGQRFTYSADGVRS